jgi:hypothetical protein
MSKQTNNMLCQVNIWVGIIPPSGFLPQSRFEEAQGSGWPASLSNMFFWPEYPLPYCAFTGKIGRFSSEIRFRRIATADAEDS